MQQTQYLESKVLTAPPQRLHLMLVEGAIRFGRQAEEALKKGDQVAAATPLLRVIDILGDLVAGVRENQGELNMKVAGVYLFLFRRASEAKINGDAAPLAEALQLLEYERQTWQLVCDKLSGDNATSPPPPRSAAFGSSRGQSTKAGISFEA
jgi:flagellar protein FliS